MSLLCLSFGAAQGQGRSPGEELIALPKGTVYDCLPNGLHYVIKPNDMPGHKIEFRLIIRAGSILQTEEEGGVAHFLEHMAFNGTTHFPGKGIVEYLESLGVKYGFGINAFTGFDRTIYMFSIPTDRPEDMDRALLILKDWLTGITIDPAQVEREKGVIMEEARGYDTGDPFYDLKVGGTRYSERMPLGNEDEIRGMTAGKLEHFYRKWYTPELATIVLVGDLDAAEAERKVKALFTSLPAVKSPDYKEYPLDYRQKMACQGMSDTLINRSTLELIIPKTCTVQRTYGNRVRKAAEELLVDAINNRFKAQKLKVSLSDSWYLSDKDHLVLSIDGDNSVQIKDKIAQAVNTIKQIREQGFCSAELNCLKENAVRRLDKIYSVKSSDQWCEDFTDLVISGERYLQDTLHHDWLAEHIRAINSKDLQALARQWFVRAPHMLAACHYNPEKGGRITEEEIATAWKQGEKARCNAYEYVQKEEEEEEIIRLPECLTRKITTSNQYVASERSIEGLGVKDIRLTNGARIILKQTKDEDQQITLTAFAPGGASLLTPGNYPLLEGMAGFMEMGGIEKMDYESYGAMLVQENMAFSVTFEPYWHGWIAMAPADKSTELCRLVYEKCFYPEKRYDDFEEAREDMLASVGKETVLTKMLRNAPDRQLAAKIDELMGNAQPNGRSAESIEEIKALNLDSMAAFYRQLYTNPGELVCVVCGNFDVNEVERNLVATLGRFPAQKQPNHWVKPCFSLPSGYYEEEFPGINEGQTIFDYLYFGNYEASLRNSLTLKLVRDVVRNRLLKVLREQESLLYSPYISLFYKGAPEPTWYFDINASVDTRNTAKVDRLLKEILWEVGQKEIEADELAALQRSFVVTRREVVNDYATAEWKKYITGALRDGETLDDLARYEEILYSITPSDVKAACREYFGTDRYVLLHMGSFEK